MGGGRFFVGSADYIPEENDKSQYC
jgi:hypothetical protein